MNSPRLTKKNGFTLMEAIVVVGVLAIVGGGILSLLLSSQTLFPMATFKQELLDEANRNLTSMSEWLMETSMNKITITTVTDQNDPVFGTDCIEFYIPYADENGRVVLDQDGKTVWGSTVEPDGSFTISLVDLNPPPEGGGGGPSTDAGNSAGIMFALKRYLSELALPSVYGIIVEEDPPGQPTEPGALENLPTPCIRAMLNECKASGDGEWNSWILGANITDLQFAAVGDRIEITVTTSKISPRGEPVEVCLSTKVTPHN